MAVIRTINDLFSDDVIHELARASISDSVDIQKDMFQDLPLEEAAAMIIGNVIATDESIRQLATDYVTDMVNDFRSVLIEEIKTIQFQANLKHDIVMKSALYFNGD